MKTTPKLLLALLLGIGQAAFADMFVTSGYLDPNAADPSLPVWAKRVGFDLGAPQPFPSEHTNVVLVDFMLSVAGSINIESQGFAVTGTGIDPYITLYSGTSLTPAAATFVLEHSPGGDFVLNTAALDAGNYVLAISAWQNYGCPITLTGCTLADRFSGIANLPAGHDTFFDIRVSGDVVPVPEPTMMISLAALATALLCRARSRGPA